MGHPVPRFSCLSPPSATHESVRQTDRRTVSGTVKRRALSIVPLSSKGEDSCYRMAAWKCYREPSNTSPFNFSAKCSHFIVNYVSSNVKQQHPVAEFAEPFAGKLSQALLWPSPSLPHRSFVDDGLFGVICHRLHEKGTWPRTSIPPLLLGQSPQSPNNKLRITLRPFEAGRTPNPYFSIKWSVLCPSPSYGFYLRNSS